MYLLKKNLKIWMEIFIRFGYKILPACTCMINLIIINFIKVVTL